MYLFIFESIGMQELVLIGVIGLIVLGPRKLPQLAKTIGKTMADFRKISGEFKSTWEKEVEEDSKMLRSIATDSEMDSVRPQQRAEPATLLAPQVKELNPAEIEKIFKSKENQVKEENSAGEVKVEKSQSEVTPLGKRDWL